MSQIIKAYNMPQEPEEAFYGLEININLGRNGDLDFNGLDGAGEVETHAVYAYIHGGVAFGLGATCPWDSGKAGTVTLPKGACIDDALKTLNEFWNNDHYYLEHDNEPIEGSMSEIEDYANEAGFEVEYIY